MSVHSIFNTNAVKTLQDVVSPVGMGFMMPEYQRPYKWSEENIERLVEDIVGGLSRSSVEEVETLFLGTLIVVQTQNSELTDYLNNLSKYTPPTGIYYVVDGQQRLSTLALMAIVLHREIRNVIRNLQTTYSNADDNQGFEIANAFIEAEIIDKLTDFYTVKFSGSAKPAQKPLIVRKSQEFWIRNGSQEYTSPIARFIADYIDTGDVTDYSNFDDKYEQVNTNQKKILTELKEKLLETDLFSYDLYLHASNNGVQRLIDIAKVIFPRHYAQDLAFLLDYERLKADPILQHLLKYCLFSVFMAKNCCVNYLEPKTHLWAIEVFQSLNSTGMPLSALEVFKAYVHQNEFVMHKYGETAKEIFDSIESQMSSDNGLSAQHKTNVYLTALALGFDGKKLGTRHSEQHKYLTKAFDSGVRIQISESTVKQKLFPLFDYMLHLSKYMHFWYKPDSQFMHGDVESIQVAYVNMLFMGAMNFQTIHPLLAFFYKDNQPANQYFLDACNATAAFYALWRCAKSSSKLDNVARDLMTEGLTIDDGSKLTMNWVSSALISGRPDVLAQYKQALKNVLKREGIWDKNQWLANSKSFLNYQNSSTLCRYILFLTAHNTIADKDHPGLLLPGATKTHEFFKPRHWMSENYNTLEHIAPQKPNDASWSQDIYSGLQGNITHTIGNLTFLPKAMNSIVGNLSWAYKHKFYSHLTNPSIESRQALLNLEGEQNIKYTKTAKAILQSTDLYFQHLNPITLVSASDGSWSRKIIEQRTEFICSLAYDRLTKWLQD